MVSCCQDVVAGAGVTATGSTAASLGKGQIETLVGDGADTFLLADGRGVFYVGGSSRNLGTGDDALILDFGPLAGDRVQLRQGMSFLARNADLGGIAPPRSTSVMATAFWATEMI